MNLIFFVLLSLLGWITTKYELAGKRVSGIIFLFFYTLFVFTVCSRIGHSPASTGDLPVYLDRFKDGEEAYFEIGYVCFMNLVKFVFGNNVYIYVALIAVLLLTSVHYSVLLCKKYLSSSMCFGTMMILFVFSLYWGVFLCDVIRLGMAMSFIIIACALTINEKYISAIFSSLLAMLFHTSSVIFVVGVLFLMVKKDVGGKFLKYWFFIMLIFDVIVVLFNVAFVNVGHFFDTISQYEMLSHYGNYSEDEVGPYFSTQYVTYHIIGYFMMKGNLSNLKYKRAVILYYIGLLMGSLFQFTVIYMRIQWIFLPMVIFVIYYYCNDSTIRFKKKVTVVSVFALLQQIMIVRQFGLYI